MLGFEAPPNLVYTPLRDPAKNMEGTDRLVMDTFIFHTFMLMNLFNMINCKNISLADLNAFRTIFDNFIFLLVLAAEFTIQQGMINLGSTKLTVLSALLGTG